MDISDSDSDRYVLSDNNSSSDDDILLINAIGIKGTKASTRKPAQSNRRASKKSTSYKENSSDDDVSDVKSKKKIVKKRKSSQITTAGNPKNKPATKIAKKATQSKSKKKTQKNNISTHAEKIANTLAAQNSKLISKEKSSDAATIAQNTGIKKSFDRGLLQLDEGDVVPELLPDALHNCHMQEIKVKKTQRKIRYMFVLPGQISVMEGGTFGSVENLDTPTPILHIDFPTQRIELRGTVMYPQHAYLFLDCHNRGRSITCSQVFDRMVVFNEFKVISVTDSKTADVLPNEDREVDWSAPEQYGISTKISCPPPIEQNDSVPAKDLPSTTTSKVKVVARKSLPSSQTLTNDDSDIEEVIPSQASRTSTRKRTLVKYNDSISSISDGENTNESSDVEVIASQASRTSTRKRKVVKYDVDSVSSSDDADSVASNSSNVSSLYSGS